VPKRVKDLDPIEGDYVVEIAGGEHHSIARTKDGVVYCWGKNDEGQCGLGDTFGDYNKQKKAEEMERLLKEEEEKKVAEAEEKAKEAAQSQALPETQAPAEGQPVPTETPAASTDPAPAESKPAESKKSVKKSKVVSQKEDDLKYIFYFYRPQVIEDLWKLKLEEGDDPNQARKVCTSVAAAGHYCYAIFGHTNEVYSWGMGENYVLGNRDDCNQFSPYLLDPRMFETNPVMSIACGTMHTVALTKESADAKMPELDASKFVVSTNPESAKQVDQPKVVNDPA
jgi:alpha-tubulin suppressor-like RCC1 family protein